MLSFSFLLFFLLIVLIVGAIFYGRLKSIEKERIKKYLKRKEEKNKKLFEVEKRVQESKPQIVEREGVLVRLAPVRSSLIMIIEPNDNLLKKLAKIMLENNYDVILCKGSLEAWRKMQGTKPDLVLADWDKMNDEAIDFLRRIRSNVLFVEIPVIFLTSSSQSLKSVLVGQREGINGIVQKPYQEEVLVNQISYFLNE